MPIDAETSTWLSKIDNELYDRLAGLSLVATRIHVGRTITLHDFLEKYISSRAKLKENTLRNYRSTQRLLEEHFENDRLISSINAGNASDYREWLVTRFANATVVAVVSVDLTSVIAPCGAP